jgi:protein O-mannosyl-transferase
MNKDINASDKDLLKSQSVGTVSSMPHFRVFAGMAIIFAFAFIAYYPCMSGGFIWDDKMLLTENEIIKAPDGLYRFWCTTEPTDYWPVTYTAFWFEWRLWGMNPTGYHVANLILHVVEGWLIWYILSKFSIPGAFLAGLIFVVHPVNVESVAWIAQRKNTMALLFFLLSIFCYVQAETQPTTQNRLYRHGVDLWYMFSLVTFMLAILSKGSVVILPVLLLGIIWWRRRPMAWDLLRITPFFVAAVGFTAVNVWFQTHGTREVIRDAGLMERLLGAGAVIWFYLYKTLLPINLDFVYPQWKIDINSLLWWLPILTALMVTAVLWWCRKGWSRPFFFAWCFFCVALVPVMGLTDSYFMKFSLVADHYQHIAIIGVIALVSAGWSEWYRHSRGAKHWAAMMVAIMALGMLAFLTWRQSGYYRDEMTLYQVTLGNDPNCWLVHNNLGVIFAEAGRPHEALEHYQQALRVKPKYANFYNNLANVLKDMGKLPEAIEQYQYALRLDPNSAEIHYNLGQALVKIGQYPEAIEQYRQAVNLKPYYSEALNSLGLALVNVGRVAESIEIYKKALAINPNYISAHNNLGYALCMKNQTQEAIQHFEWSLKLKPDDPDVHLNLGNALYMSSQPDKAIEHYRQALKLNSRSPEAHNSLGVVLAQTGRSEEAIDHYKQAIKLRPNYVEAHSNFGNILCDLGRWQEAIEQYEKALNYEDNLPQIHKNLGLAYRAKGQYQQAIEHLQQAIRLKSDYLIAYNQLAFTYAQTNQSAEAIATAQKALDFARSKGWTAEAKQIELWLNSYRAELSEPSNPLLLEKP